MELTKCFFGVAVIALVAGCAMPERLLKTKSIDSPETLQPYDTQTYKQSVHTFDAIDLLPTIERERWVRRVDNVLVLWDEAGLEGPQANGLSPQIYGREVLRRFHRSMPDNNWKGMLITTGNGPKPDANAVLPHYSSRLVESALDQGKRPYSLGAGPLAPKIDQITEMAVVLRGRTAVYLITQWSRLDARAVEAIARFHQRTVRPTGLKVGIQTATTWYGKNLIGGCFHAVGVGNTFSREKFMDVSACASAETFDAIAQPRDMAHFVSRTLYSGPSDSDGDGIADYLDQCPDTPPNRLVNSLGCLRFPDSK